MKLKAAVISKIKHYRKVLGLGLGLGLSFELGLLIWNGSQDYSQILLPLISIFSQNIDEFEKQVQTLESVHPLISKYRQAG